jgi:hypothetical protein
VSVAESRTATGQAEDSFPAHTMKTNKGNTGLNPFFMNLDTAWR